MEDVFVDAESLLRYFSVELTASAAAGQPQGWKFMSCSHCQELCQQASWLLISSIKVKQLINSPDSKLTQFLTMNTTHTFPPQVKGCPLQIEATGCPLKIEATGRHQREDVEDCLIFTNKVTFQ